MRKKDTKNIKISEKQRIKNLFRDKASTRIDLGCGENKMPGSIGVDFRQMKGVDIVQNLTLFPWENLPSKCTDTVMSSHLLEHINPAFTIFEFSPFNEQQGHSLALTSCEMSLNPLLKWELIAFRVGSKSCLYVQVSQVQVLIFITVCGIFLYQFLTIYYI